MLYSPVFITQEQVKKGFARIIQLLFSPVKTGSWIVCYHFMYFVFRVHGEITTHLEGNLNAFSPT